MALIVAVGGSGQHVAGAIARLAWLGALPKPDILVIDADVEGGVTRSLLDFGGAAPDPSRRPIPVEAVRPLPNDAPAKATFEQLFDDGKPSTRELFEAFFDPASAGVRVHDGMFGNPAVGATVFAHAARDLLKVLKSKAAQTDQVFVAGSFVGGTGAGVLHQLLRTLRDAGQGDKTRLVALLPWHQPPAGTDVGEPLSSHSMRQNMSFGCDFLYQHTRHWVASTCLLGVPTDGESGVRGAVVRSGEDAEQPHLLHAIGAWYTLWAPDFARTAAAANPVHTFAWDPSTPGWLGAQKWCADVKLDTRLRRAQWVAAVLDHSLGVEKDFASAWNLVFGTPKDTYHRALFDTITGHAGGGRDRARAFAVEVWKDLRLQRRAVSHVLDWADRVFGGLPDCAQATALRGAPAAATAALRQTSDQPLPAPPDGRADAHAVATWFREGLFRGAERAGVT